MFHILCNLWDPHWSCKLWGFHWSWMVSYGLAEKTIIEYTGLNRSSTNTSICALQHKMRGTHELHTSFVHTRLHLWAKPLTEKIIILYLFASINIFLASLIFDRSNRLWSLTLSMSGDWSVATNRYRLYIHNNNQQITFLGGGLVRGTINNTYKHSHIINTYIVSLRSWLWLWILP